MFIIKYIENVFYIMPFCKLPQRFQANMVNPTCDEKVHFYTPENSGPKCFKYRRNVKMTEREQIVDRS